MKQIIVFTALFAILSCLSLSLQQGGHVYSNKLTLQFDYAVTQNVCFYSAEFQVLWNGQTVLYGKPWDYDLHTAIYKLEAKQGKNILAFAGKGHSDGKGVTVGNIKLYRDSIHGLQDLACNGDFIETYDKSKGKYTKIFKNSITGWSGKQIEVGYGKHYNSNWPQDTYVTDLDANQNTVITQTIFFMKNFQIFYQIEAKEFSA